MKNSLGGRIALAACGTAALVIVLLTALVGVSAQRILAQIADAEYDLLLSRYDELIRTQVQTAVSLIDHYYERAQTGEIGLDQARVSAADALRELRYGEEGYFWVDTVDGVNVVLLGRDVEGSNRLEARDVKGGSFIRDIIDAGSAPGGGYTDYWFPRAEGGEAFPKRGYSLLYQPFGWVVGTGNYIDDIEVVVTELRQANQQRLRLALIVLVFVALGSIALSTVATTTLGRRLTRPLGNVSSALSEISKGAANLTQRLSVASSDEVGTVARSFDEFVASLQTMIGDIKTSTGTLGTLGGDLAANTTETAAAVNQITANIESLKQRVQDQGTQVDTTAASVEQLTRNIDSLNELLTQEAQTIQAITTTLGAMLDSADTMLASAGDTQDQIESLRHKIEAGNASAEEMAGAVEQMSARSLRLQEANEFIVGIAAQTNLLAMNAAIEAAHAGEAGRGFSVVAEEIRKLADQASEQSGRIAQEIRAMDEDIGVGVDRTSHTKELLVQINATVDAVKVAFASLGQEVQTNGDQGRRIRDSLGELTEIATALHTGASEMSRANEQILGVVTNLNEATVLMSESMDEIVVGTREINSSVTSISEISNTNREMIGEIVDRVALFET